MVHGDMVHGGMTWWHDDMTWHDMTWHDMINSFRTLSWILNMQLSWRNASSKKQQHVIVMIYHFPTCFFLFAKPWIQLFSVHSAQSMHPWTWLGPQRRSMRTSTMPCIWCSVPKGMHRVCRVHVHVLRVGRCQPNCPFPEIWPMICSSIMVCSIRASLIGHVSDFHWLNWISLQNEFLHTCAGIMVESYIHVWKLEETSLSVAASLAPGSAFHSVSGKGIHTSLLPYGQHSETHRPHLFFFHLSKICSKPQDSKNTWHIEFYQFWGLDMLDTLCAKPFVCSWKGL